MSYISTVLKLGMKSPLWLSIWDALMANDLKNLDSTLDYSGWHVTSSDDWELYDIIVRFKRYDAMVVYLSKVPYWYLIEKRFQVTRNWPGCRAVLLPIIKKEVYKRAYIRLLLGKLSVYIPLEVVNYIWSYTVSTEQPKYIT